MYIVLLFSGTDPYTRIHVEVVDFESRHVVAAVQTHSQHIPHIQHIQVLEYVHVKLVVVSNTPKKNLITNLGGSGPQLNFKIFEIEAI